MASSAMAAANGNSAGRLHPNFLSPNGAESATLAPSLHGTLKRVRLYDRYLLTSEGVANWVAGGGEARA